MTTRRRTITLLIGVVLGAGYGYGLMAVALAGLLGGGGASFFLLVATSPLLVGFASWPVVGGLLAWRDRRWTRVVVASWLGLHGAWAAAAVILDGKALAGLARLARALPLETTAAVLFWVAGQVILWWLVATGRSRSAAEGE